MHSGAIHSWWEYLVGIQKGVIVCRTFGKGLIQSVYELSDGSGMVITNGKYLTPALTDIDREGIAPDFKQPPSPEAAASRLNACMVPSQTSV